MPEVHNDAAMLFLVSGLLEDLALHEPMRLRGIGARMRQAAKSVEDEDQRASIEYAISVLNLAIDTTPIT